MHETRANQNAIVKVYLWHQTTSLLSYDDSLRYLFEPVERISKDRIGHVILCELRYQLLKLSVEQLNVCHALMVNTVTASAVSL